MGENIAFSPDSSDPVLIIGAGCTGLAIANGLKKAGIQSIIFEKDAAITFPCQRDWNMGIHWGFPILKSLIPDSAHSQIQSCQVDPHIPTKALDTISFVNGATGDLMVAFDTPYFYRLRRSKLRELMARDLDIRCNKRLKNIKYEEDGKSVTCIFDDGQHVRGRLAIGADGASSSVRSLLLGPEKASNIQTHYKATMVQATYTREQAIFLRSFHPLYYAAPHPNSSFAFFGLQHAPDPDAPETWVFFFYISWNASTETQDEEAKTLDHAARLRQVRERGKEYTEPWKSALEWLPDDHPTWRWHLTSWDPREEEHRWDNRNGRVTLAGDAAHTMTPQRGQGLNHSFADAQKLVEMLSTDLDQASAIAQYEEEMKTRAGEETQLSVVNTTMLHDWTKVLESPVMTSGMRKKS